MLEGGGSGLERWVCMRHLWMTAIGDAALRMRRFKCGTLDDGDGGCLTTRLACRESPRPCPA